MGCVTKLTSPVQWSTQLMQCDGLIWIGQIVHCALLMRSAVDACLVTTMHHLVLPSHVAQI